ncbi:hypothetical protein ACLBXM_05905 [Xanthobacteraceae bacterium A53D]
MTGILVRISLFALPTLALALATAGAASAAPILPKNDRAGALMRYQVMIPADRQATIEAFTNRKLSAGAFHVLDTCTMRETTDAGARSARLATTISGCVKETGQ